MINGQYWKLHMIVLLRSSWYKNHTSIKFYRVLFVTGNYIFPKVFFQIYTTRRSLKHILPNFMHILTATLLWCCTHLRRRHCDVTALLACPQQPYSALAAIDARSTCFHCDLKPPSHRTETTLRPWRPKESTRSPYVRQISEKTLLCVTAIGTVLRSHGALTRNLCEPNCTSNTTSASVRRSYCDLTAPWTRAQSDHQRAYSDATTT